MYWGVKVALTCEHCNQIFLRSKKFYNLNVRLGNRVFCSRQCQGFAIRNRTTVNCSVCGTECVRTASQRSRYDEHFCSHVCANGKHNRQRVGENHPGYDSGQASYRDKALDHYGMACTVCGYDTECVLEVHHRDGNRRNNKIENLDVLCPTHHDEFEHRVRVYVGESSNLAGHEILDLRIQVRGLVPQPKIAA